MRISIITSIVAVFVVGIINAEARTIAYSKFILDSSAISGEFYTDEGGGIVLELSMPLVTMSKEKYVCTEPSAWDWNVVQIAAEKLAAILNNENKLDMDLYFSSVGMKCARSE